MKRKAVTLQLEGEIPQPQSAYDAAVENGYEGSEEQYGKEMTMLGCGVTQQQFDAIPGRLTKLTTTTEKSDFHHITDSAADKVVDFGMEGKTEQKTTSGKNLCNLQVGKKFNPFTGEIGESKTYAMCIIEMPEQMDVTVSVPSGEEHGWYLSYMQHNGTVTNMYHRIFAGQSKTITLPKGTVMLSGDAIIDYGIIADEFKPIKVQIELGSTATTYEPYTGAQPSPNPDYPQEIVNAGVYNEETGRYEIGCVVGGKNILVYNCEKSYSSLGVDFTVNEDGSVTIKGTNTTTNVASIFVLNEKMLLKPGRYILTNAYDTTRIALHVIGTSGYIYSDSQYNVVRLTTDTYVKVYINVGGGTTVDTIAYPMLRLDGDDSTFAPVTSKNITLTSPVPLTKWDKLVKRDGVWGWSVWSKEYDLSIDEMRFSYTGANEDNVKFYIGTVLGKHNTMLYCNILKGILPAEMVGKNPLNTCATYSTKGEVLCILSSEYVKPYGYEYSADDSNLGWSTVKTAVPLFFEAIGGIQIWCEMSEEQAFHPLPEEEQELLNNLETYYGITNLYNNQGCPMWLTYVQDTKTAVDNKFNNIRQAILSLGGNV